MDSRYWDQGLRREIQHSIRYFVITVVAQDGVITPGIVPCEPTEDNRSGCTASAYCTKHAQAAGP